MENSYAADLCAIKLTIYDRPLTDSAAQAIKLKFRQGEADLQIIEFLRLRHESGDLVIRPGQTLPTESMILCSLRLN